MNSQTTILSLAMLVAWTSWPAPARAGLLASEPVIPFPDALQDAGIVVPKMSDAQSESLFIGNGDLYGIVWEKEGSLFLRITKNDIWDARVDTSKDGPLPKVNIRTREVTGSKGAPPSYDANSFPEPVCAAALRIGKSPVAQGALDLQHAVATITSSNGGKTDLRVLADKNVLLITTKESVSLEPGRGGQTGKTNGVEWLHVTLPGDLDYKGMEYCVAVAGTGNAKVVSLVTSFDITRGDVRGAAIALANKTAAEAARSKEQLIADHEKVWHTFWARSGVELGDRDLQHWWYRMMYFARTVSQPGGRFPAGIMPPLATDKTPWHADFHFNYNSWQPFWSVISPNHPELADPWISYIHGLLPRAQWQAKEVFDCEGAFCTISHFLHEPDPAVCKSVNQRSLVMNPWGMTIGMVGMTAQNLWHKHLCDPDRAYLEAKIYPSLREAARFYLSFMKQCHKDADGKILLGPSYSPEHGAMGIDNCPFDIAYVHYTFDAFDKASKELGKDRSLAAECLAMKALLADYPVALDPDGKPVVVDWTGCKYREVAEHNLTVPAAPVFPAEQVTWFSPEPVKELFHRTIQDTKHNGNNSHVVFNIAKARLSMPEAVPDTKAWFKSRELPNGLFVWQGHQHGTFMPESIGVAAIVTEFLMQSVGDIIRVFPCWPKEQDAKFTNLRAQGGFLISAEQKDGKVTKLEVTSTVGGTLRLLNPWTGRIVERTTQPGQKLAFTGAEERTRAPKKAPAGGFLVALGGEWRLELDRQDVGVKEKWFTRDLSQRIQLPGSMSGNGLGDPITGIVQHAWDKVIDQPTWHPMLKYDYRGAAWYQQSVTIPQAWQEKIIELSLERVCWQSELWVDDIAVGRCDSLSAPHCYELGVLKPGTHRLTLRIDNRKLCELGLNTHAYHEQSCTIFNGVIGRMELQARPAVFVRANQVYTDPAASQCELRITVVNKSGKDAECTLTANVMQEGHTESAGTIRKTDTVPPGETVVKLVVQVPQSAVKLWSEFDQPLFVASVAAESRCGVDNHIVRFGFRSYTTRGTQFLINGKPVLLRGEANNAQFPLSGYPPMDKAEWLKIFKLFKAFGLNHFRCHTWTPPEAAFAAADDLGIYLQPELPNCDSIEEEPGKMYQQAGNDPVAGGIGKAWRQAEFDRILDTYGNHPSFVQITMGNEARATQIDFLKGLVKRGRERDGRQLYACSSNPEAAQILDEVPGDDFAVAHGGSKGRRRMHDTEGFNNAAPETVGDYRGTMAGRPVPQIAHEVGQWYVYPDLSEIEQYTGVLRPVTLEHFRNLAAKEGVLSQVPQFVTASGQLSLLLYKEEVERSLRTPHCGGFQLLGLQDSFDQGAAYVGQLNNFFKPKPYVAAAMFREFCSSQVLLARLAKRVWLNDETFTATIELANYGPATLKQKTITWQLVDGKRVAGKGKFGPLNLPDTGLQPVGTMQFPLAGIRQATKLELQVDVEGTDIRNRWDLWVFPTTCNANTPANVKVVRTLDPATVRELRNGARVVLLPEGFKSDYPTAMTPPFWSPIMFTEPQITGFLCDPKHLAFRKFPTDSHSNWQWYELLHHGYATRLEGTPANYRPIVQGIDRPDRNHKLALIYETRVGKGSLLVCTLDLNRDLDKCPVARQLRRSLLDYAASPEFHPATEIDLAKNVPTFSRESDQ